MRNGFQVLMSTRCTNQFTCAMQLVALARLALVVRHTRMIDT